MQTAKFAPPIGPTVLERDRLIQKLVSWEDRKLVLIHGPAGQGKSTLAASYVRTLRTPWVWYTLDRSDDEPRAFLDNLAQATARSFPRETTTLPPLPRQRFDLENLSPAVVQWVHTVFGGMREGLLVLDDYLCPAGPSPLARLLKELLDATPSSLRFLLVSRARPSLDLNRLRARRLVGELTGNDLRFSDAETADLFTTVFSTPILPAEAARLNRMTEGWAAGLVLMHEYRASTQEPPARSALSARSPGFQDQVFDYLAHEVFSRLPADLQGFLLRTSVTDHLPDPLVRELTGISAAGAMVQELLRRNLFVSTDSSGGTALRYHALFREFLQKQLLVSMAPAAVRRLQATAARYFLHSGDPVRAIELYQESGQFEKAFLFIERAGQELIASGRTRTLLRLLDALPPREQEQPWSLYFRAIAIRFTDPRSALTLQDRAHRTFRASGDAEGQMLSLCGVIEACFHGGGDFRRMARAGAQARALLRTRNRASQGARSRLTLALGIAWFFTGRLDQSIEALQAAMKRFHAGSDLYHEVSCAIYLVPCALYHGDLALAQGTADRAFEAQRRVPEDPGGEAALHLVQAMAHLFSGDAARASASLDSCRRLVQLHGLEAIELLMLAIGGWIRMAQGDLRSAEVMLTECLRAGERSSKRFFSVTASHLLSIVYLFQRKLDRAERMADRALLGRPADQGTLFRGIYLIMNGAIHGEFGKPALAAQDLREAIRLLRACRAVQQEANAHLMLARLLLGTKQRAAALRELRTGFSLGEACGITYYAPFTSEQVRSLAVTALEQGICEDHCRSLLERPAGAGAAPALRVFCLGRFQVERNGTAIKDVQWKSRRARTLIKLLAAQGGRSITRDRITDLLWPKASPDRHPALFSSLLHRLRRVIDPPDASARASSCVIQEGDQVLLNRDRVWTDVTAFTAAVKEARQMRSARADQRDVLKAWEKAVGWYSGSLLPEDVYEDWALPEREQLRRLYTEALDAAAEISDTLGDAGRSHVLYERMFSFDPCHDQACRWLMARHAADGQRNKAVRVYERHELAVRKELDIEPDERTRKLYRSIIGG